jgi:hypothetical protein
VAFDALTCFVWIDPYDADGPRDVSARGAGALCTRHADLLVAPRGWAVQDRRGRDLQLWSDRPASAVSARGTIAPPSRANKVAARGSSNVVVLEQPLPFAATTAVATSASAASAAPSSSDDRSTPRLDDDEREFDHVLDAARGPLLSRAFNAARTRQAG